MAEIVCTQKRKPITLISFCIIFVPFIGSLISKWKATGQGKVVSFVNVSQIKLKNHDIVLYVTVFQRYGTSSDSFSNFIPLAVLLSFFLKVPVFPIRGESYFNRT